MTKLIIIVVGNHLNISTKSNIAAEKKPKDTNYRL